MTKSLKIGLVTLLVLTLAMPAWAGRGHRSRHYYPHKHHHSGHHHRVHLHAVGAGLLGLGLITGAAIAASALHQPKVVVHRPAPPPPPASPNWYGTPYRHHRHHPDLGSAHVTAHLLNVRQNPGRHHPILLQVPKGTYLSVQATSDGWLFVRIADGRMGWVMKRYTTWGQAYADG
ncbi:MAG: SH3 domain-containing protein [Desulfosarcinaceae bacterium]|nr:SH3 domain-containing protein [Desulfosarcinaceae bacterium]